MTDRLLTIQNVADSGKELVSAGEAARRIRGVTTAWIMARVADSSPEFPSYLVGRFVRFNPEEVREFYLRWRSAQPEWIYFVQAGDGGPVKIGRAVNVKHRLAELQTAHYEDLRLLVAVQGTVFDERRLHREFQQARIRGEWFHPVAPLLALAERLVEEAAA